MSNVLSAKPVVDKNINDLINECNLLKSKGVTPYLKVILVGDNPASVIYTKNKKAFCEKIGAKCDIIKLSADIDEEDFLNEVENINNDNSVHGLLIQLPLPKKLKHLDVTTLVNETKDVDGFHPLNVFELYKGNKEDKILAPCTPKGIVTLCKFYNIDLEGKKIVVVGRSLIVGKPLALLLMNYNATVTICHSKTKNLKEITKGADIIISAIGQEGLINCDHVRDDKTQIVIDVGINKNNDNKTVGDCDFQTLSNKVKAITPVPGGIGPMTILSLAQNLLQAAKKSLYP